ncbi:diguanylate cyclase [Sedimenticola sp.]|uniref:sensor domain-containing diguanylate cyclase n=1 Tax=Sedimenticola sp. TaxID=1940285 RepID=UPI003D0E9FDE
MIRTKTSEPLTILLVEDNPHDQLAFTRALKQDNSQHRITECVRAESALELICKQKQYFDIAVIDHKLPGISGLEMCQQLLNQGCSLPMVILTGRGSERLAVEALKLGVDDYIVKEGGEAYLELLPIVLHDAVNAYRERQAYKSAEEALKESERLLGQIVEQSSIPTFVIDKQHTVTHWNRACSQLTGVTSVQALGSNEQWRAFYPEQRPVMADLIVEGGLATNLAEYYRGKFEHSDLLDDAYEATDFFTTLGENGRWLFFTAAPLRDEQGNVLGAIETLQDITARRQAEEELESSKQLLQQIVARISVATFVIDQNHRVTHWNDACAALTGHPSSEMLGTTEQWRAFYTNERPVMADLVLEQALDEGVAVYYEGKYKRSNLLEDAYEAEDFFPEMGESGRWLYFTAAPLRKADGTITGAIETLQDITERKMAEAALRKSEQQFRQLSITDGLTALYNSRHFYQQLATETERSRRHHTPLSLLLMDVDHFKRFNDQYGHLAGDEVLIGLADSIRYCLRNIDSAYRYGGEEFVVLMPNTDLNEASAAAERLRIHFNQQQFTPDTDSRINSSISIGVAQYHHADSDQAFIRRADTALYTAKESGRNRVEVALDNPIQPSEIEEQRDERPM